MSEWAEIKLGEIASFSYGTMPKKEKLGNGPYPTFSGYRYQYKYPEYNCENDDLIVVARGVGGTGDVKIVKEKCYLTNLSIKIGTDKSKVDNRFLYYFYAVETLRYLDSGSAQSQITIADLSKAIVPLPNLEEQKSIASVLSSLDDKIDLLHRQNKTLEAMAETLFRQWFVEEAGDWVEIKITDLFEVRDGTHDSPKQKPIGKPLITSKHILDGRLDIESAYLISDEDFDKVNERSKVHSGDILFSMIGTIGLIYFERSPEINYVIKNIGLFKTSQNQEWAMYTYLWLKSPIGRQFIDEHKSGSTQEYVSLGSLRDITFQKPPKNILAEFNKIATPLLSKTYSNQLQIQALEKLRDSLLPKLMSGEVRVV